MLCPKCKQHVNRKRLHVVSIINKQGKRVTYKMCYRCFTTVDRKEDKEIDN